MPAHRPEYDDSVYRDDGSAEVHVPGSGPGSGKIESFQVSTSASETSRTSGKAAQSLLFVGQVLLFVIIVVQFIMFYRSYVLAAAAGALVDGAVVQRQGSASSSSSNVPDYYVTKPELLPGKSPPRRPRWIALAV